MSWPARSEVIMFTWPVGKLSRSSCVSAIVSATPRRGYRTQRDHDPKEGLGLRARWQRIWQGQGQSGSQWDPAKIVRPGGEEGAGRGERMEKKRSWTPGRRGWGTEGLPVLAGKQQMWRCDRLGDVMRLTRIPVLLTSLARFCCGKWSNT